MNADKRRCALQRRDSGCFSAVSTCDFALSPFLQLRPAHWTDRAFGKAPLAPDALLLPDKDIFYFPLPCRHDLYSELHGYVLDREIVSHKDGFFLSRIFKSLCKVAVVRPERPPPF